MFLGALKDMLPQTTTCCDSTNQNYIFTNHQKMTYNYVHFKDNSSYLECPKNFSALKGCLLIKLELSSGVSILATLILLANFMLGVSLGYSSWDSSRHGSFIGRCPRTRHAMRPVTPWNSSHHGPRLIMGLISSQDSSKHGTSTSWSLGTRHGVCEFMGVPHSHPS